MGFWFWHGLQRGIRSTRYPARPENTPGVSPGHPVDTVFQTSERAETTAAVCPVGAIIARNRSACVDHGKCIHCQNCRSEMNWDPGFEWTRLAPGQKEPAHLPAAFKKSMHIIVVDAGDCGACLHEVRQLNNPLYNMHRLGFFLTATPRNADLLLVVGPVSENMRGPLLKTWEAMPGERRVMAVGSCAISGGVFGRSFICAGGVGSILPVDFEVPGNPPPPLAILHGLLAVAGRKPIAGAVRIEEALR